MSDAQPQTPNPAPGGDHGFGTPPGDEAEQELMSIFGLGGNDDPGFTPEPVEAPPAPTPSPAPAPQAPVPGPGVEPAAPTPGPAAAPAAPTPSPAPAAPTAAPTPPAAPAEPVVDEQKLKMSSLEAQVAALQAQLAAQQPQAPAPAGTPAAAAPGAPEEAPPEYNLAVPDQLLAAINSDDEGQQKLGIAHLVNSLARVVHTNLRKEVGERLTTLRSELAAQVANPQIEQQQKQMRDDYFTAFPHHNKPDLAPLLSAAAQEMAAQYPNAAWDDNYRNALGMRVTAKLTALGVQPGPAPTPVPQVPQPQGHRPVPPAPAPMAPAAPPRSPIPSFETDSVGVDEVFMAPR